MSTPKIYSAGELGTQIMPFTNNANELVEQAKRAEVKDQESFDMSVDFIKICNSQLNRKEEMRKQLTKPLNDHIKWINDQFRPVTERIEEAKKIMNQKATDYQVAEQQRREAEAKAERERQEELALQEAEQASERGDEATSEAILDVASETPEQPAKAQTGRGSYTGATGSLRGTWKGEVVDVKAVCQAIIDGEIPATVIKEFSRSELNKIAKAHGTEEVFHGIKCYEDKSVTVR